MSPARSNDSYLIYSELLRQDSLSETQPVKLVLVDDTTTALVKQNDTCSGGDIWGMGLNPHSSSVKPPPGHEQDWKDMLEDFDQRCHERVSLNADTFKLETSVRTVSAAQRKLYMDSTNMMYVQNKDRKFVEAGQQHSAEEFAQMADFSNANAIFRLSEVYFNAHHNVAMVYFDKMRGQSSYGGWKVFEFHLGRWEPIQKWVFGMWES
jgi:hypothetical protein